MKYQGLLSGLFALMLVPSIASADDDDAAPPREGAAAPSAPVTTTSPSDAPTTVDTVHLRNGGMLRGRVAEIVPGDHLTILVEAGDKRRVAWAEVERVVLASAAIPRPVETETPAEPPPPMVGPKVRVHVTSKTNIILYRRPAGANGFVEACKSPCDTELPLGDTYRLTGNGVPQSRDFRLHADGADSVDLVVDPPNKGGMVLGGLLAGVGGFTAYVGLLVALNEGNHSCSTCSTSPSTKNAGFVTLGVGAAAAGLGLLVFFSSASTDINQKPGARADEGPKAAPDAFLREPTWKTTAQAATLEGGAALPAATFPLLFQHGF